MPRRGSPLVGLFLVIVFAGLLLLGAAYLLFGGVFQLAQVQPPVQPQPQPQPQPQTTPAKISVVLQDIDTGSGIAGSCDVIDPADMTKPLETISITSGSGESARSTYVPGQRLQLHCYGSNYYPAVFDIVVPSSYTLAGSSGSTYYVYPVGVFGLKGRSSADSAVFSLYYGATLLSDGDGDTRDTTPGSFTPASKIFQVNLQINLMQYSKAFGRPVEYINARYEKITLRPVVWIAFNQTAISSASLTSQGWIPVSTTALTGYLVFYKVLDPVESSRTALGSATIPIQIDASSLAQNSHLKIQVWIADMQNPSDAAAGVGTTTLTAYGAYSGYGISPMGFPFTTSAGAPANALLEATATIPAS
ncbi:MAG: hypothetical protein QXP38_00055 [Nitrososphaerota archaeon]